MMEQRNADQEGKPDEFVNLTASKQSLTTGTTYLFADLRLIAQSKEARNDSG